VGRVDGAAVSFNVLAGSGASALDKARSVGAITTTTNNTDGWHDTSPWYLWLKKLLRPINVLWLVVALLILVTAIRRRHTRGGAAIEHPYAAQLAQLEHIARAQNHAAATPASLLGAPDKSLAAVE
jgi:hypothetical protein